MYKFIRKSYERILCKLSESEILWLYSIVHVAIETSKKSNFTCQSKSFISIFFTCQVAACKLQPFSCHDLANDLYSQTARTVFSHLNKCQLQYQYFPRWRLLEHEFRTQHPARLNSNRHSPLHGQIQMSASWINSPKRGQQKCSNVAPFAFPPPPDSRSPFKHWYLHY